MICAIAREQVPSSSPRQKPWLPLALLTALSFGSMLACEGTAPGDEGSDGETSSTETEAELQALGSGGGCRGSAVASCISLARTDLLADLYQNSAFDSSRCTAYIEIRRSNGGRTWGGPYDIRSNGRRGPVAKNIITLPPSSGWAINRVHIYTCAGNYHHYQDSPRQYYP